MNLAVSLNFHSPICLLIKIIMRVNRYFIRLSCACLFLSAGFHALPVHAQLVFDAGQVLPDMPADAAEEQQNMLLVQGDIFVSPSAFTAVTLPGIAAAARSDNSHVNFIKERGFGRSKATALWPDGIINYVLDESLGPLQRERIREAIAHWNNNTRISLRDYSWQQAEQSLPADYIVFEPGPGCASWVGRQGGAQTVWVSEDCNAGSIVHELGHAVGLLHEHTRFDRDSYINVLLENVEPGKSVNFDILTSGARLLGEYDYESIMHYGSHFFSGNSQPTIMPLNGQYADAMGQRNRLSNRDVAAVNGLYSSDVSLGVSSHYDASRNQTRVQLDIDVLYEQGVHRLLVEIAADTNVESFYSNEGWSCQDMESGIACKLDRLGGFQSSQLLLDIAGFFEINSQNTGLVTRTFDINLSNNGKPVNLPAESPVAAAALHDGVGLEGAQNASGGVMGLLPLVLMYVLALLRLMSVRGLGRGYSTGCLQPSKRE